MQPVGVEIAGSNSINFFSRHFCALFFNPNVTVLLEYLNPAIYTRLVFSL